MSFPLDERIAVPAQCPSCGETHASDAGLIKSQETLAAFVTALRTASRIMREKKFPATLSLEYEDATRP